MAWDFTTEPEFARLLDWADGFVTDRVYKVDALWPHDNYKPTAQLTPQQRAVIGPLKDEVREHGLWACHLGPELGGQGYGQLKLALLNEILGKSIWGPRIFAPRRRTPATRRSSPTSARPSRRPPTWSRCCPATSSPVSR